MIIALSGKKGSGKDTVADMIVNIMEEKYRNKYRSVFKKSYAYKLKQIVAILTDTTIEQNLTTEGKNTYISIFEKTLGQLQQIVGTECFRNVLDTDIWVKALLYTYTPGDVWLITDCRFPNEVESVKNLDGLCIRINRNLCCTDSRDLNHPSEIALDNYTNFDYIIDNNCTLDELRVKVEDLISKIFK